MQAREVTHSDLLAGIHHQRVREIISAHRGLDMLMCPEQHAAKRQAGKANSEFLRQTQERQWLAKKGKEYLIDFDAAERREMKQYFNSLDEKKNGSIGIEQLEEFLLSVGLFETRQEVKALIEAVDQDHSGKIQFQEFLCMIQNDEGESQQLLDFFKSVIGDKDTIRIPKRKSINRGPRTAVEEILQKYPVPKGLPFEMVVNQIRRKYMLTALNIGQHGQPAPHAPTSMVRISGTVEHSPEQIAKGQRVMKALRKMYERRQLRRSRMGLI